MVELRRCLMSRTERMGGRLPNSVQKRATDMAIRSSRCRELQFAHPLEQAGN